MTPRALGIELSELGDHFLGEAIAEIILRSVSGKIFEGQDCQHYASSGRLRSTRRTRGQKISTSRDDQDHRNRRENWPEPKSPVRSGAVHS